MGRHESIYRLSGSFFLASLLVVGCQGELQSGGPGRTADDDASQQSGKVDTDRDDSEPARFDTRPRAGNDTANDPRDTDSQATKPDAQTLPCDTGFSFTPDPPVTGKVIQIDYTHPSQPYAHIGLDVSGPGGVVDAGASVVSAKAPYHWRFERTVDKGGTYTFTFTSGGDPKASCQKQVQFTGAPPDVDPNNNDNNKCTCGSGQGCSTCPVEGSCFDSPSKYHPDPNQSGWKCLDNAGCSGGNCKIWCPFEPCQKQSGCSNNTEACYVPPGITDYEAACKHCCESAPRNAIWNAQDNYCEEPGQ